MYACVVDGGRMKEDWVTILTMPISLTRQEKFSTLPMVAPPWNMAQYPDSVALCHTIQHFSALLSTWHPVV